VLGLVALPALAPAAIVDLAAPKLSGKNIFNGPPRTIAVAQANTTPPGSPLDLFTGFVTGSGTSILEVGITSVPGGWAPVTIGNSTQDISVSGRPNRIALGDVTGDGNIDLAVANEAGASFSLGAANGSFGALNLLPGSTPDSGVAMARMDANSSVDLIAASTSSVGIYFNTGSASVPYNALSSTAIESGGTTDVATGDLDGDGDQDIVTAVGSSQRVIVLLNSFPSFGFMRSIGLFTRPVALEVADLDGNGRPEVLVTEPDRDELAIISTASMLNEPRNLGPIQRVATGIAPVDVATGDLDGDGRPEAVVANAGSDSVTIVDGSGSAKSFAAGPSPVSVAIAEVTGDARPDVVVANDSLSSVAVLANLGPPAGPPAPPAPPAAGPKRTAKLSCAPTVKAGLVKQVVCMATLSDRAGAKSAKATLKAKGAKRVLASATAAPGKKLTLKVGKALAPGRYLVDLTVTNKDGSKLAAQRGFKVSAPK
jgi:hypothetical protein